MKSFVFVAMIFSAALLSQTVFADQQSSCAADIQSAVSQQAQQDFKGETTAVLPVDMQGWDGGYVTQLNVKVAVSSQSGSTFVTYGVFIDEVCSVNIESGPTN